MGNILRRRIPKTQMTTSTLQNHLARYVNKLKREEKDMEVCDMRGRFTIKIPCGLRVKRNKIHLGGREYTTGTLLKGVTSNLRIHKWDNIKTLKLKFATEMNDKDMNILKKELTRFIPSLKCLSLEFYGSFGVTDANFFSLMSRITRNGTSLERLTLRFYDCLFMTKRGVLKLVNEITSNLYDLKHLRLGFDHYCKITDEELKTIKAQILKYMQKLEYLGLSFYKCDKITEVCVLSLGEDIAKNLRGLKILNLKFSGNMSDQGIRLLGKNIGRYLINLRRLNLTFNGNNDIKQETWKIIKKELKKKLPWLREFSFSSDKAIAIASTDSD